TNGVIPVLTYVLTVTELGEADLSDDISNVVSRIGYEWIASLVDRVNPQDHPRPSPLTSFIEDFVGIAQPGQPSWKAATGQEHAPSIPQRLLDRIGPGINDLHEFLATEIKPFLLAELVRAADDRDTPDPARAGADGVAAAERLLEIYGPRLRLTRMREH